MLLKAAAVVFALAGGLALADGLLTLVWQEPISGLLAHFQQARLAQGLKRLENAPATPAEARAIEASSSDNERIALLARELQRTARAGQAVGRIRIPRIGANFVVVAGTDESSLQKGPGIYAGTAVPGLRGTVGIAGHRTTYLAPFRRINELQKGDRITLEMPYGFFTYAVLRHEIVSPNNVSVLAPASYDQVVLTACNPLYSAAQRIVVFAKLTALAPAGAALLPTVVRPAPALLVPARAAAMIIGDTFSAGGSTGATTPPIGSRSVLLGNDTFGPRPPVSKVVRVPAATHRSAPRSGSAPARPAFSGSQRAPVVRAQPPVSAPVPQSPVPQSPAPSYVPPRQVEPVSPPAPTPSRRPAVSSPRPASPPVPVTQVQPQARVQGQPGGPAPIIGVPSGG